MAENKSQAKHLTSLDFDISGILESLRQADEQTQQMGLEIGKNFSKSVQQGANESSSSFVNEASIEAAKNKVNELNSAYGELVTTVTKFKDDKVIGSKQTFVDSDNVQTVVSLNKNLEKTVTVTQKVRDVAKEMNAAWEAYERTQAGATTRNQQKQLEDINAAYAEKIKKEEAEEKQIEINSKKESDWYYKQLEIQEKEAAEYKKVEQQLDSLIEKQQKFNNLVSRQRTSSTNRNIISQNDELIKNAEYFKTVVQEQGVSIEDAKVQLETYQESARKLGTTYDEVGTKGDSFLKKIADKATWLGAFYIVNELYQSFGNITEIIKETEDAVVDLQRVLNTDVSQSTMSDELYGIAEQYGRTFDEVAEVSTAFAQAGYDWNDTMELTKGTMLALNTAELDVTQSTQGLIAILSQWNLEAEDYASVIDKINVTADNFAVNSENIVAALQRASSSAKNANISLEETIGIITALAEATGRSGENIGTALNSLIIYTSKASALDTFAENGSAAMKQVVEDYRAGAVSIYDVWVQLSEELKTLTASQKEALFSSEEYQEFANELEAQATEFTSQVNDIYGAAGTYRQNYFIALLNDMATAQDAIEGMSEAEGYSVEENEKYMASLTANFNQLKAVLAELAVQAGEAGILDFLKGMVQAGIQLATLTKNLGGIIPLLTTIGGILVTVKQQKITDNVIIPASNGVKTLVTNLGNYVTSITSAKTATEAFKAAASPITGLFTSFSSSIGFAITAFSLLNSALTAYKNHLAEQRQAVIDANNATLSQTDGIYSLISSYNSLSSLQERSSTQEQELKSVNEEIVAILGARASQLDVLVQGTQEYIDKINDLTEAELRNRSVSLTSNVQKYGEELKAATQGLFSFGGDATNILESSLSSDNQEIQKVLDKYLGSFKQYSIGADKYFYGPLGDDVESLNEWIMAMTSAKSALEELGGQSQETTEEVANSSAYKELSDVLSGVNEEFNNYIDALVTSKLNEELISEGVPKTAEEFENFKEKVFDATGANEDFRDEIYEIVNSAFPDFSDAAENAGEAVSNAVSVSEEEIEELAEAASELSSQIDDFQSAYDAVNSAIEEYNEYGYLSIDTIQQLISMGAQYWDMLNITADGVSLNENALGSYINTQQQNIDMMIQQEAAAEILRIAQEYLGTAVDNTNSTMANSSGATNTLASGIANITAQAIRGTASIYEFDNAVKSLVGGQVSGGNLSKMTTEMNNVISNAKNLRTQLIGLASSQNAWNKSLSGGGGSGGGSGSSAQSEALKEQKELLQDQKKAIQEKQKAEKEALEEQKDLVKERYDAEIQALKDVQEEEDRLEKQREYYRNRQEALNDIEKASTRSGVEYREQEEEARQKLQELDEDWQEQLKDWDTEDKIAELERLRDAEVDAIEKQIDSIEKMYDAQIDSIEKQIDALSDSTVSKASSTNKQLASSFKNDFVDPSLNYYKNSFSKTANEVQNEIFTSLMNPLGVAGSKIHSMFALPSSRNSFTAPSSVNNQSVYNTNTRNANVYANVYGQSSANNLVKSIFTKP